MTISLIGGCAGLFLFSHRKANSLGMYTEFHFNVELKQETPQEVIDTLVEMANHPMAVEPPTGYDHEFFHCDRWKWLFTMSSYYFPHNSVADVYKDNYAWYVNVRSNLKDYTDEIEKFLKWIAPYVLPREDFMGIKRYEEQREPTILYLSDYIDDYQLRNSLKEL